MHQQWHIGYDDARKLIDSCAQEAQQLGIPVSVAVLDGAGHIVATARLDGAAFQTIEVATGKALTAVMTRTSSKTVEDATLDRPTLATFRDGRLPIQGGLPLSAHGACVGAIGVSGGTSDQDERIAAAGVTRFTT
jgi:uncharacterized protein GlcG (DUF336 family)